MTQTLWIAFFPVTFHAVILASTNDASPSQLLRRWLESGNFLIMEFLFICKLIKFWGKKTEVPLPVTPFF